MNESVHRVKPRRSLAKVLLEFLGSMNLAITLLVALAIASAIGTGLQQDQLSGDYVRKFGPFWYEVFKSLGLFDIYGAVWFITLLSILLISTGVCIYRNTPAIIKDMRHFRLDVLAKSLRSFHHHDEWRSQEDTQQTVSTLGKRLQGLGYRIRFKQHEQQTTLAAMKGSTSRLGYLLSHVAIIVICVGGLIDGNLPLKWAEWRGDLEAAEWGVPLGKVPPKSILPEDNTSFRGMVYIAEGSSANALYIGLGDGFLLQKLPFRVELEDFRIEHYPSGQPKSFESTLIIHDDELDEPLRKDISVNHPLTYKGYAIYQADLDDGGSKVDLKGWSLDMPLREPLQVKGTIGTSLEVNTPRGPYALELSDFKMFNIFPLPEGDPSGKKFQNYGPSVIFKLRAANGEAREYVNYMAPVMVDGRPFFLSGMRESPADEHRFLHIPIDPKGGVERFMRFLALAKNEERVRAVAQQQAENSLGVSKENPNYEKFTGSMVRLVEVFVNQGIDAIVAQTEQNMPEEKRSEALSSYIKIIQGVLSRLYLELLVEEGVDISTGVSQKDARYFDDAINAFSLLGPYGSPMYLKLEDFTHIEASGLQITKAPGQNIVYLGCVMLMFGVFFMFYLHHRRLWVQVSEDDKGTNILFAATSHRDRGNFKDEFEFLRQELRRLSGAAPSHTE